MGIQFVGVVGITESCVKAVLRYLQFDDLLSKVFIITNENTHALILHIECDEIIAVKSGFRSGYNGEGPKGLSYVLSLINAKKLEGQDIDIEEYEVKRNIIEKINASQLSCSELKKIEKYPVRPVRWLEYMYAYRDQYSKKESFLKRFPLVVPFSIIDERLFDLSISFWENPNDKIFTGYKRLEDAIRKRCNINGNGGNLFKHAFKGNSSFLYWPDLTTLETEKLVNLFTAIYGGFRNRRAHKEIKENPANELSEFLMLNHLFRLEAASKIREKSK